MARLVKGGLVNIAGFAGTIEWHYEYGTLVSVEAVLRIPPGVRAPKVIWGHKIEDNVIVFERVGIDVILDRVGVDFTSEAGWTSAIYRSSAIHPAIEYDPTTMPAEPDKEDDGLYTKYRVFKEPEEAWEHPVSVVAKWFQMGAGRDLEEVTSFIFPLKPDTDPHARVALAAYAWSVAEEKPALSNDLRDILDDLS